MCKLQLAGMDVVQKEISGGGILVDQAIHEFRWDRKLPNQVGLKTALVAEDLGLIESKGDDLRARTYRLISGGSAYLLRRPAD
jgi:hypothetical protein